MTNMTRMNTDRVYRIPLPLKGNNIIKRKDECMATFEIDNKTATVRIHDEFCSKATDFSVQNINRIVTDHYKRKVFSSQQNTPTVVNTTVPAAELK